MIDAISRSGSATAAPLSSQPIDPAALADRIAVSPAPVATVVAAIDKALPILRPVQQGSLAALRDAATSIAPRPLVDDIADPQLADTLAGVFGGGGDYGFFDKIINIIRGIVIPLPMELNKLLGPEAAGIASRSPTLTGELKKLEADGWQVQYGTAGAGTFADRTTKTITIDPKGKTDPQGLVQSLAHEVGHASYDPKFDYSSSKTYLRGALGDEGEATLNNIQVQREILASGGPDIGIAGNPANHAAYIKAYESYQRTGDRQAARDAIGKVFGDHERTSTTGQTYRDYYLDGYHRAFPGRK